ncbi:MAG TPA: hypothetical protein VFV86_06990, partial [Nitrososphaeraceae archaeon]|nr:hypothetical protein [Nitrososphaeraceae archaeon]
EIKIVGHQKLVAHKNPSFDENSKLSYKIKLNDRETFTIHKHKNHITLYPSFDRNSKKYAKIKNFVLSRGIPIKEFSTSTVPEIINFRIFNPEKHITFLDSKLFEIKMVGGKEFKNNDELFSFIHPHDTKLKLIDQIFKELGIDTDPEWNYVKDDWIRTPIEWDERYNIPGIIDVDDRVWFSCDKEKPNFNQFEGWGNIKPIFYKGRKFYYILD